MNRSSCNKKSFQKLFPLVKNAGTENGNLNRQKQNGQKRGPVTIVLLNVQYVV